MCQSGDPASLHAWHAARLMSVTVYAREKEPLFQESNP